MATADVRAPTVAPRENRRALFDLRDCAWSNNKGPAGFQLFLATFGILALELAIIRWSSGQIRILAYFNNLVLVGAFLGMGLGVALGRRYRGLVHGTLPLLALLSLVLAYAEPLGLTKLQFPDASVHLWGAEVSAKGLPFLRTLGIVLALFWLMVSVFVCAGSAVGHLFQQMASLRAYSYDLAGSLLGVVIFAVLTAFGTGPHWWIFLGCLSWFWLSRRLLTVIGGIAAIAFAFVSVDGAVFSPYNRIEVTQYPDYPKTHVGERPLLGYKLDVNRDFHQFMLDFSQDPEKLAAINPEWPKALDEFRTIYDLPFVLAENKGRALIVGAGSGNDVHAALRNKFAEIYAVDIDPVILALGQKHHPERPYDDARVRRVANDARAFFQQYRGEPFDVICYGLLDSHAMFSAMSSVRLENYVYTVEGFRSSWNLLAPGGTLVVSFSIGDRQWIADRLHYTLKKATGQAPVMIRHGMHRGFAFMLFKDRQTPPLESLPAFLQVNINPKDSEAAVKVTTDNWPFLYINPDAFPFGYVSLLIAIIITSYFAVRGVFGGNLLKGEFDLPMFLMGAAFLLIETREVTQLSLLFGSTWIVNASVFGGILLMVLLANLLVEWLKLRDVRPWFIPLLLSVVFIGFFDQACFNDYSLVTRALTAGVLNSIPIGFAGVIVSIRLSQSANPSAALGCNLLGALIGGCLEYLSMWFGLQLLAGLAFFIYLLALLVILITKRPALKAV